jgi:hypothetical protein
MRAEREQRGAGHASQQGPQTDEMCKEMMGVHRGTGHASQQVPQTDRGTDHASQQGPRASGQMG